MPKRRSKKRKNKHEYYYHYEPQVECLACGHEHLYRQRKRIKSEDPKFLTIGVCPKCEKEGYVMYGDKETRRIKKKKD